MLSVTKFIAEAVTKAAGEMLGKVFGWNGSWLSGEMLTPVLADVEEAYQNPKKLVTELQACYPTK